MSARGAVRIAMFVLPGEHGAEPDLSAVTREAVARLRSMGADVELVVPERQAYDLACIHPRHDLYVLKSKSRLALAVAGALGRRGAAVVNTVRSCVLTRDKITATALMAAAGVPVPASWATGDPGRLRGPAQEAPLWLKASRGSRGQGVRRLAEAAELSTVTAPSDCWGLPEPLFAQREVESSGRDLKVFVAGPRAWAITRVFPARTPEDKLGRPAALAPEIEDAALRCGRALGLELYGVDFLVSPRGFAAVDVNAFPGFKGVAEAPAAIAAHLFERALGARGGRP